MCSPSSRSATASDSSVCPASPTRSRARARPRRNESAVRRWIGPSWSSTATRARSSSVARIVRSRSRVRSAWVDVELVQGAAERVALVGEIPRVALDPAEHVTDANGDEREGHRGADPDRDGVAPLVHVGRLEDVQRRDHEGGRRERREPPHQRVPGRGPRSSPRRSPRRRTGPRRPRRRKGAASRGRSGSRSGTSRRARRRA